MARRPAVSVASSPAIPIDTKRALNRLENLIYTMQGQIDEHSQALSSKQGNSASDLLTLANQLRSNLQANGASPLNIAGLPGVAAQPQKSQSSPTTSGTGSTYTTAITETTNAVGATVDVHANRGATVTSQPNGALYFETDRLVLYVNVSGSWTYAGGVMTGLLAAMPNDLGSNDTGFLFYATDTTQAWIWNGSAWQIAPENTIQNGQGAPANTVGTNGDFYLDTLNTRLYGPKAGGAWPATYTSLIGPAGPTGPTGATGATGAQGQTGATGAAGQMGQTGAAGANGTNGNTVLNGTSNPTSGQGNNGDFYLNTSTEYIYGPKANNQWPATGVSLVGPQGPAGSTGATGATGSQGPTGATGATGAQGPAGPSGTATNVWG